MSKKPEKTLYENQAEIWESAKKFLVEMVEDKPVVQEALVWASLAEGKFGLYKELYRGQEGSDIDLVVITDESFEIPHKWSFTTVQHSCFDLYKLGKFTHEGHNHPVDGLLVFPSRHNLQEVRDMLAHRSKSIYIKSGKSILENLAPKEINKILP